MFLNWSLLLLLAVVSSTDAPAQFTRTETTQAVLVGKAVTDQAEALAEIVRKAWPSVKCSLAAASLQKTFAKGEGGWLVICDGEVDYWVTVPVVAATATVLQCALARAADQNCYTNLRTVTPEYIKDCDLKSNRNDPVIRSCTAIIQSGRLTSRPDALAIAYATRAMAYGRYSQKDLALADFDDAVALQPDDVNIRFNRAVALERKGKFEQAIADLDKVLAARPDFWNASYERGYIFMQNRDYDRAIIDFDQVLRVNPGYEKAVRQRADALQAKQGAKPAQGLPPKGLATQAIGADSSDKGPIATELDGKAAYCMEASFGFLQRETKFIQLVKQNQEKLRAVQGQAGLTESDRSKIEEGLKGLDRKIAQSETSRVKWDGNLKKFIDYLQRHELLSQKSDLGITKTMSAKAGEDQRAVQEIFRDCQRACTAGNESCRTNCDEAAESSQASQRMKQCDRVAKDIR